MAITTTEWVSQFVDALDAQGLEPDDLAALKASLLASTTDWLGSTGALPVDLAQKVVQDLGDHAAEMQSRYDFWFGAANGGPNGDGMYPFTLTDGTTVTNACLAKLVTVMAKGDPGGVVWTFDSATTDADPGAGKIRLNHATPSSVTALYIDNLEAGGSDMSAFLDRMDDAGSVDRGTIMLRQTGPARFLTYKVTGAVVNGTGYRKVPVTHMAGSGGLTNGATIGLTFTPVGVSEGDTAAYAADALASKNAAASSASSAAASRNNALTYSNNAATSETNAGNSATSAAASAATALAQANLIAADSGKVALKTPGGLKWGEVSAAGQLKTPSIALDFTGMELAFVPLWPGPSGEIVGRISKIDGSVDFLPSANLIAQVTAYVKPLAEAAYDKTAGRIAMSEMGAIREPVYDNSGNLAGWIDGRGYYNFYGLKVANLDPATVTLIRNALVLPDNALGRGEPSDVGLSLGVAPLMVDRIGATAVRFLAMNGGSLHAYQTRRDVASPGAMIEEATGPIQVTVAIGDSKAAGGAGSGSGDAVQNLLAPFPYQALMLSYPGIRSDPGTFVFNPATANDIVPAHEESSPGETQGTGAMRWLIDRETAAGERRVTRAYYSAAKSGQALAGLQSGSESYTNAMAWLDRFVGLAAKYGRTVECDVFLKEGTNDQKQRDRAYVLSQMTAQRSSLMTDIVARTGQSRAPRFFVSVTETPADNRSGSAAPNNVNEIAIGQQLFAESFDNVFLTTCPYWFKGDCAFTNEFGTSDLHNRNPGYVLDGECMAEAMRVLGAGGVWTNIRVKAVTRSAAVIDVEFYADNLVGALTFDTTQRPDPGNYGFAVYDTGGTELTISSIAVVSGQPKVRITLAADPGAQVDATYLWKVGPGATLQAGTWGNLRDSASIASNVASVGTRAHWALPFFKRSAT